MPAKKRIIFVDDEPNVLDGLRRMLHNMRNDWDMYFVTSGLEALALLEREPFDVIVTDMRMPIMNGAALLIKVMENYPQVIRIALSGQSDDELVLDSVKAAHQYLTKPCDSETLKNTISRSLSYRNLINTDSLNKIVSQMDSLPSLPSIFIEITKELQSPDSSIRSVANIISKDIGMSAQIMKLVNSAFFGFFNKITDIVQAVSLLGIETIKSLVLTIHLFSEFKPKIESGFPAKKLWDHSFNTGKISKAISILETGDKNIIGKSFIAGTLHDIGKIVLVTKLPEQYEQILVEARNKKIPLWQAELEHLGSTHAEVGAYLLGLWGMSESIVEAIALHHQPNESTSMEFCPLTAVYFSNIYEHSVNKNNIFTESELDNKYLNKLGYLERLPVWEKTCNEEMKEGNANV